MRFGAPEDRIEFLCPDAPAHDLKTGIWTRAHCPLPVLIVSISREFVKVNLAGIFHFVCCLQFCINH